MELQDDILQPQYQLLFQDEVVELASNAPSRNMVRGRRGCFTTPNERWGASTSATLVVGGENIEGRYCIHITQRPKKSSGKSLHRRLE